MESPNIPFDPALIIRVMRNSLSIQSHFQLLLWMQGDFQETIRHDAMISFSGAIGGKTFHYDIVSAIKGIRALKIPHRNIHQFRARIHEHWAKAGGDVTAATITEGCSATFDASDMHDAFSGMKHVLFHAIPDTRFKADHLYILLRHENEFTDQEKKLFELLLPHIDVAVRKIDGLPVFEPELIAAPTLLNSLIKAGLSTRELEILEWVRNGKTNIEIGMILEISSFTVKNHLQRIFKKINVSNRAQAVGKLEDLAADALNPLKDAPGISPEKPLAETSACN